MAEPHEPRQVRRQLLRQRRWSAVRLPRLCHAHGIPLDDAVTHHHATAVTVPFTLRYTAAAVTVPFTLRHTPAAITDSLPVRDVQPANRHPNGVTVNICHAICVVRHDTLTPAVADHVAFVCPIGVATAVGVTVSFACWKREPDTVSLAFVLAVAVRVEDVVTEPVGVATTAAAHGRRPVAPRERHRRHRGGCVRHCAIADLPRCCRGWKREQRRGRRRQRVAIAVVHAGHDACSNATALWCGHSQLAAVTPCHGNSGAGATAAGDGLLVRCRLCVCVCELGRGGWLVMSDCSTTLVFQQFPCVYAIVLAVAFGNAGQVTVTLAPLPSSHIVPISITSRAFTTVYSADTVGSVLTLMQSPPLAAPFVFATVPPGGMVAVVPSSLSALASTSTLVVYSAAGAVVTSLSSMEPPFPYTVNVSGVPAGAIAVAVFTIQSSAGTPLLSRRVCGPVRPAQAVYNDRIALEELYAATGAAWYKHTGWGVYRGVVDVCVWSGVACVGGRVA